VAEDFRLIESGMIPIIITRDEQARRTVAKLSVPEISSGFLARQLQLYTVQIPVKARNLLIISGRAKFICPELRADQFAVLQDETLYTNVGLLWEDAEYLPDEGLVI